jgi:hypothetical protein
MERIQRKRTKGYKMPENTIYVGRPTKWGNPFKLVGDMIYIDAGYRRANIDKWVFYNYGTIDDVVALYELLLTNKYDCYNPDVLYWQNHFRKLDFSALKGSNLSCFCSLNQPCHVDAIMKHLNTTKTI